MFMLNACLDNMRLLATLLLFSAVFSPFLLAFAGGLESRSLIFPEETSTSYVEMVPQRPMALRAFTLCMRLATELRGEREIIYFAYRTRDYDELNVWRELDGRLSFYLSGEGAFFDVPQPGALESHLCVTWESSMGLAALYLDGKRSVTKLYKRGHAVRSGGKVILGQDPDNYLGNFDAQQSFVGEISDVNMWDYVLPHSVIQALYSGGRVPRGNVFDWDTTELKVNGRVSVVTHQL